MKVLVACEESQAVCKAFRTKGHEAYSCDIIECSGGHPEWHIQGDALTVLNPQPLPFGGVGIAFQTKDGARWLFAGGKLNEERFQKGLEAKEFFMAFLNADCERIAVENPIPSSVFELPAYSQTVQPYEHGHPHTKKTCLWLKGLDPLTPSNVVEPIKGKRFQQKNGNWRYSCWEMEQKGGKNRAGNGLLCNVR